MHNFGRCVTSLVSVQVVVIGQDPYHGPGQAHGLAFSVQRGVDIPPSLRNIIKETKVRYFRYLTKQQVMDQPQSDPAIEINNPTGHGNLEHWSEQGVLMLNTVLTVRRSEANSHQKKGSVWMISPFLVVMMSFCS